MLNLFDKLMRYKKKDLCGMIMTQNADKNEMEKYINQLELEAIKNDLEYHDLLKYKNELMERLRK
tara:strand:- start:206 stop:400 length:195 start_codon:yes stop_codon:yes gene_type:complete